VSFLDLLTIIKNNKFEFLIIGLIILVTIVYCIYPQYGYTMSLVALLFSFIIDLYKNSQIKNLKIKNEKKNRENLRNEIEINMTKLEDLKNSHKLFHYNRPLNINLKNIIIPNNINLNREKLKNIELIADTTDDINRLITERETITTNLKRHPTSEIVLGKDPLYSDWYNLEKDLEKKINDLIKKSKKLQK
jgi:hypothetical protein